MKFLKKNWGNIIFGILIIALLFPSVRKPVQVFVNRTLAMSPSEKSESDREVLKDYSWRLNSLQNQQTENFSQSKNRVAIVNFWATWCPPCIAEMPSFQKLYDAYGDKVDFYFIANDKNENITKFFKKRNLDLPVYKALEESPKLLDGFSLPTTYVLDKNGAIVIDKTGSADWNSDKMHKLLDKLLE